MIVVKVNFFYQLRLVHNVCVCASGPCNIPISYTQTQMLRVNKVYSITSFTVNWPINYNLSTLTTCPIKYSDTNCYVKPVICIKYFILHRQQLYDYETPINPSQRYVTCARKKYKVKSQHYYSTKYKIKSQRYNSNIKLNQISTLQFNQISKDFNVK